MTVTSTAQVVTDRGERYRKQLAGHFGNKIEVTESPAGTVLTWGFWCASGVWRAGGRPSCPGGGRSVTIA